jgi:hypothetical protein
MSATVMRETAVSSVTLFGAMAVLAALDILGALFAKGWVEHRSAWSFAAGAVTFLVLFVVYAHSLELAELSTVTFGWIVCLQVGLVVFERIRYAVALPTGKMIAIVAILALQAYLVLGANGVTTE